MFKSYGITGAPSASGALDAIMQRLAQARRIRRFCQTKGLGLSGNSVMAANTISELYTAFNLCECGWIDYVVITNWTIFSEISDERIVDMVKVLVNRNALIVLDEVQLY